MRRQRISMKGIVWIVAWTLIGVSLIGTRAHAQSEANWHACPVAFAAIKMLVTRLKSKVSADDLTGISRLVCTTVKFYTEHNKNRPEAIPLSPEAAERFFCAQSLKYCGKTPLAPPTFKQALRGGDSENFVGGWAVKCMQINLTAEGCAVAILKQAIADAQK